MLPVPAEYPVAPIVQFPNNNPPTVPYLDVQMEFRPYVSLAAALVANEAGYSANNSHPRMFCYNLLCENGWNNIRYFNVVKLVLDSAAIKRIRNPNMDAVSAIHDSFSDVLTIYTSSLIFEFSELQRYLSPDQIQSAQRNVSIMNSLSDQIARLYNTPAPRSNMQYGVGHKPIQKPTDDDYSPPRNRAIHIRKDEPVNTSKPHEYKVVPVMDTVLTGEIENMDREKHCVVYYGRKIAADTPAIRRQMVETIETHKEVAKAPELYSYLVFPDLIVDNAANDLCRSIHCKSLLNMEAKKNAIIYRGLVPEYILARKESGINEAFTKLMTRLSQSNTFVDTQEALREALKGVENDPQSSEILAIIGQVNRVLTRIFQDMLLNVLEHNTVTISSFIEDASDAIEHIARKYGAEQRTAINKHQETVYKTLFSEVAGTGHIYRSLIEGDEEMESLNVAVLMTSYTLIYYPGNSLELSYYFSNRLKNVTTKETPLLDDLLMTTLQSNKDMHAMNYRLVTQDGVQVNIYRVHTGEARFRAQVV